GTVLEKFISFEFRHTTKDEAMKVLFETGVWNGHIIAKRHGNNEFIFNANVSLLYDEKAEVSAIVFVNHNITEEEHQQKKLQFAKNKYEIVVESLSEGVMLIDSHGTIATANKQAAKILGFTDDQLKGLSLVTSDWNAIKADGSP